MDTRLCDTASAPADRAGVLVCESTFSTADAALARDYRHLIASQAGRIAAESAARLLVLTHLSQRYSPRWRAAAGGRRGQRLRRWPCWPGTSPASRCRTGPPVRAQRAGGRPAAG